MSIGTSEIEIAHPHVSAGEIALILPHGEGHIARAFEAVQAFSLAAPSQREWCIPCGGSGAVLGPIASAIFAEALSPIYFGKPCSAAALKNAASNARAADPRLLVRTSSLQGERQMVSERESVIQASASDDALNLPNGSQTSQRTLKPY